MRILLTNDDGILAPGLWHVAEALQGLGEVLVCAPDREQSGYGNATSLHTPIRVTELISKPIEVPAFAVEGTPADSVILALECLIQGPVDLVVSGINVGSNLGEDVLISGTIGAAFQGHLRGIPSIAISVATLKDAHFEPAGLLLRELVRRFSQDGLSGEAWGSPSLGESQETTDLTRLGTAPRVPLLNINLPNLSLEELAGVSVTRLGLRSTRDTITQGHDGRHPWYWITRGRPRVEETEGTDVWAIHQRQVSITPLAEDLTVHAALSPLKELAKSLASRVLPLKHPLEGAPKEQP